MAQEVSGQRQQQYEVAPPRAAGVAKGGAEVRGRRQMALVMDEVDGMSAGDRGGVADLIKTIHKSKVRHPSLNQYIHGMDQHSSESEGDALPLRPPCTAMACPALATAASPCLFDASSPPWRGVHMVAAWLARLLPALLRPGALAAPGRFRTARGSCSAPGGSASEGLAVP